LQVILHAYLEYGLEFLQQLAGMFAFALYHWSRRRLILARDRLGIKPCSGPLAEGLPLPS
jgi:asparagine synthase (glutamine-hydrolysing)